MPQRIFSTLAFFMLSILTIKAQDSDEQIEFSRFGFRTNFFSAFSFSGLIDYKYDASDFEINDDTYIYGCNAEVSYHISPYFGAGLGLGYEKITQPEMTYYPLYLNLSSYNNSKESMVLKASFGVHLGQMDQPGFLFKGGLGYRTPLYKNMLGHFELQYSFQNMYKTFENSGRNSNYYNMKSLGISVGFEIK